MGVGRSCSKGSAKTAVLVLGLSLCLLGCAMASAADATAKTDSGMLRGATDAQGVSSFLGIPFAAPPVGDLRWKAPQPVEAWSGVRDARQFGPVCMQNELKSGSFYQVEFYQKSQKISEDCLYLNVWTTAKPGDHRPAMLWIHGGGFVEGSGSLPSFD